MVLAGSASAAIDIVESDATITVNYADFADDKQKTLTVSTSGFTVRNTDTTNQVTVTITASLPTGYSADSRTITIAAGQTSSVINLPITLPHSRDSGNESIGTITVSGTAGTESIPLKQVTKPMISLEEIEVDYTDKDGDIQTDSFDANDEDLELENEVSIGTEMTFTITIENIFDKDYDDGALENIDLSIDADSDLFKEFEENYDFEDLDSDDSEHITFTTVIDNEADEDSYTLEFTVEGEDQNGAMHTVTKTLTFDITRKRDDIRITSAKILPSKVTACDNLFYIDVELENFGTKDQKFVSFVAYNEQLDINKNVASIELGDYTERDNTWKEQFTFPLNDVVGGTYYLELMAYADLDKETDKQRIPLVIEACGETGTPNNDEDPVVEEDAIEANVEQEVVDVVAEPETDTTIPETEKTTTNTVVQSVEASYSMNDLLVGGIIVVVVLLVALIALFIAILVKH